MTAGHTFYLEELNVKAGRLRVVLRARGRQRHDGGKRQTSDIYFLQIRPLRKEFKRAESDAGAGGGGGGGGGGQVGALSQQQRQIIAATFNVNRDRKTMSADKVRENSVVIALSQAKLRDQVDGLLDADEQPPHPAGPVVQEDRGSAPAGRHGDEDRRGEAAEGQPAGRARARAEGAPDPAAGGRRVRDAGADAAASRAAAAVAAAAAPWPRTSPTSSSSSSTRWPTSTRPPSARSSSSPIRSSTSCSRS